MRTPSALVALLLGHPVLPPVPNALARPRTQATVAPDPAPWEGFPVFVWRKRYQEQPLPEALAAPFGGTNLFRGEAASWIAERGLSTYLTNACGRDTLHLDMGPDWNDRIERWIGLRDPSALVREPCLSDPATVRALQETLRAALDTVPDGTRLLGVSLGDEVSLTPNGNPLDLCRSKTCLALWAEHAKELGLPTTPVTTDDVRRDLAADDFETLGAWLEQRRFHHRVVTDLLGELAAEARTLTDRPLGLLGASGATAFGGVPLRWAADTFDFLELYPVSEARELAGESAGGTLATVFLQQERRDAVAWMCWEHWMRGGDGIVVWNDALLEDRPAHGQSLARVVERIRALEARAPLGAPLRPEVAILHDEDCVRAAWLRDALVDGPTWPRRLASHHREHGSRERKVRTWLRLLEDAGLLPRVVDVEDVVNAGDELPTVVLALDHLVLGKKVQHALRDHMKAGGVLLADGELGWVNDGGGYRKDPTVARWKKIFRTLLDPPDGIERYLERRWRPAGASRLRAFATELAAGARRGAPTTLERLLRTERGREAAEIPWLTSVRPIVGAPDRYLVCMIPNYASRAERETRMRPWTFELTLPPGLRLVEWLAPGSEPRGRLEMDGALVFEIEDVRGRALRSRSGPR